MFVNRVGRQESVGRGACERVKGDFSCSFHTGTLIVSGLPDGDGSKRSLCVSVDCGSKTCVRWIFLLSLPVTNQRIEK